MMAGFITAQAAMAPIGGLECDGFLVAEPILCGVTVLSFHD
jgi:hypothetical protein